MTEFYERQTAKDCSIHSLNNAVGYHMIDATDVVNSINRRVAAFAYAIGRPFNDPDVTKFKDKMSQNNTFFSAEAVWNAARELNLIAKPIPFDGFGGNHIDKIPLDMMHSGVVFLGVRHDGNYHAIGARNGMIYDSLSSGDPVPITPEELKKAYKGIFSAYKIISY